MGLSTKDATHVIISVKGYNRPEYRELQWRCAGCGDVHTIPVRKTTDARPSWGWNGDMVRPTLTPSILKHANPPTDAFPNTGKRCHSFVKDGAVQFLDDCNHELAGQTVAMLPENADPWTDEGSLDG